MSEENKAVTLRRNRILEGQASEADEIITPGIVYQAESTYSESPGAK